MDIFAMRDAPRALDQSIPCISVVELLDICFTTCFNSVAYLGVCVSAARPLAGCLL